MSPLEQAYVKWDRMARNMPKRPGHAYLEAEAKALGAAIQVLADELGLTPSEVRDRLSVVRGTGASTNEVVALTIESFS